MSQQRNEKGHFAPGNDGNPNGRRPKKTAEQRLLAAIERDAPALVERGLTVGMTDNQVLAQSLAYLTECLRTRNIQAEAELHAIKYTSVGRVH